MRWDIRIFKMCVGIVVCFGICADAFAYVGDCPPFDKTIEDSRYLQSEELVNLEKATYLSSDRSLRVLLSDIGGIYRLEISENGKVIYSRSGEETPIPNSVYNADINRDGLDDFIIFNDYRGNGVYALATNVVMLLKKLSGEYAVLEFDTYAGDIKDFVDINNDGRMEIIVTELIFPPLDKEYLSYREYVYLKYRVFTVKDSKFVDLGNKIRGFPKQKKWVFEKGEI